ncbi:UNVERIFIED_CONTAM: Flavin mononucleotide hydrolase 1, chloroplatic, partial [Sesamum radiatum]
MLEGSKPEDVKEWYDFGALASVHTMSPSFPKISKLPEWISGAVYDSLQNNPHLKRGDMLELKFVSTAPETAGNGSHPAFHFIKLQRPDMVAFNKIKAATGEAPLVSTISEDDISTKRAWGLWVCLTEIDKVKYPFKIFSNNVNGSFLLNSMTGKNTEFAERLLEKKRMLIWENKLPATEATRMKTCNMLHVGQWHNHVGNEIGLCCLLLKESSIWEPSAAVAWLEEVRKNRGLGIPGNKAVKSREWIAAAVHGRSKVGWEIQQLSDGKLEQRPPPTASQYSTINKEMSLSFKSTTIAAPSSVNSSKPSRKIPVLLFDIMDTIVRDPFYHDVPAFFGWSWLEHFSRMEDQLIWK